VIQNEVKFDYQKGDSGSAPLLEIKCVIIEALNLDTKFDQKHVNQLKINKNDQKSTKSKNRKINKIRKSEKVTKCRKSKSSKSDKMEK